MVKDRLAEMESKRDLLKKGDKSGPSSSSSTSKVKESNKSKDSQKKMTLTVFLSDVSKIEVMMNKMTEEIVSMDRIQKDLYSNPFYTQEDVKVMNVKKLDKISDGIMNMSLKVRKEIDVLRADVSKCAENVMDESDTNLRMKSLQVDRLTSQLGRILNDYRAKQAEYVDKTKARLKRQADIVHANDTEADNLLNNSLFTGDYLAQMQKTKFDLQELQQRETELKNLEKDVMDVHRLFKEINQLVMGQGETVDRIESNIEKAAVHVEMGDAELTKARIYAKKARRRRFIIIGIVLIVLLIIGAIIAISLTV